MLDAQLQAIRDLIQEDVGNRGLRTDPAENLITACAGDFAAACRSIAETPNAAVGVVTGFYIPSANLGETDGPLGALYLARALAPLGIRVVLLTDHFCVPALAAGIAKAGLRKTVPLVPLPAAKEYPALTPELYWDAIAERTGPLTHLIALERSGPSHTPASLAPQPVALADYQREAAPEHHDRNHTMRGLDITEKMSPAHLLFEAEGRRTAGIVTIGIGDGGNEIGMGKIPWEIIHKNIPRGGLVACRIPTDHLIVCGVSNWGGYALAAGVRLLRGQPLDDELLNIAREEELLAWMVKQGPLVDGVSGQETATVDGLTFERYAEPLRQLARLGVPVGAGESPAIRKGEAPAELSSPGRHGSAGASPSQLGTPHSVLRTGQEVREKARAGQLNSPTAGLALGFVQANLVVVPRELAFDFLLFCQRNPKPCPLLDVTEPGDPEPKYVAPGADLRTDLPRYRVYEHGMLVAEPTAIHDWWRKDLVGFVIGCSFTFENALLQAGVPLRHLEQGCNVPMYQTKLMCRPAGIFRGPTVVSMRPMTPAQAMKATQVCSRFPRAHGAPLHLGDPSAIGIRDLNEPDFGDRVEVRAGEIPVFWACGVTPQAVAMEVKPPLLITHKPGCMFLTDLRDTDLEGE
jgi:uncharacterized protein YcsI (UPF0317 family)